MIITELTVQRQMKYQRLLGYLYDLYGKNEAIRYEKRFIGLIESLSVYKSPKRISQKDAILIAYPDHIQQDGCAPLVTLGDFCRSELEGVVSAIHILPHYPSTSDDGFAVSDYLTVDSRFGTWKEVEALGDHFGLMLDGVFNHTSASHEWFRKFLAGDSKYRDYYIQLDKDTDVSDVVRPRTTPLLTDFLSSSGVKHVWTTFSADQVDLNFANPDVLLEVTAVLLSYIEHGAEFVRLDAIAFIWKELGTNSIHHPKTHTIIRFMREIIRLAAPWVQLVTETNVPHDENITYFGDGQDEANLVYNFALPPLVVHTLQTGDASKLSAWIKTLKTPSDETHFYHFTASHDGIGVRAVEHILTTDEVKAMSDRVVERGGLLSMKVLPDGNESLYEMNCTFFDAVTDPSTSGDTQIDQFICSQAIALSLKGIPGIYLHSLLGSRNWTEGVEQTNHNRTINRQKLQLEKLRSELDDPGHERAKVFDRYRHLLEIRRGQSALHPSADQKVIDCGSSVLGLERRTGDNQILLAFHNVTNSSVDLPLEGLWIDLVSGQTMRERVALNPYQVAWLVPEE